MCSSLRKWGQEVVRYQEVSRRACLLQKFQGWCLQWKEVLVLTTIFILLKLELYMFDLNTNNNNKTLD